MKSSLTVSAVVLGLFVLAVQPSAAQPYANPRPTSPYARPQLSPYLNMLRGGSPAANYYLGVVPEIDRRQSERAFGTAIQDLERRVDTTTPQPADDLVPRLPSTGHPAYFMNYSSYFNVGGAGLPGATASPNSQRNPRSR